MMWWDTAGMFTFFISVGMASTNTCLYNNNINYQLLNTTRYIYVTANNLNIAAVNLLCWYQVPGDLDENVTIVFKLIYNPEYHHDTYILVQISVPPASGGGVKMVVRGKKWKKFAK